MQIIFPVCSYHPEPMEAFPDSKDILTVLAPLAPAELLTSLMVRVLT